MGLYDRSHMVNMIWTISYGRFKMKNITDLVWRRIRADVEFHTVRRRIMANNDDNQVFQFLPSTKFGFPLYRAQVQLENLRVRKIFEIELGQYAGLYMHLI